MKINHVLSIKAPIEIVFAFIEEADAAKEWDLQLESVTNPHGFNPKHPKGTVFVQGIRNKDVVHHTVGEVTAYDKPHRLCMHLHSYDYTVQITYRLSRLGKGTKLHYESDLTSSNWLHRIFLPVTQNLNKRSIIQQLQHLKIVVEKNYTTSK